MGTSTTTTIRVDRATHAELTALSEETGSSVIDTVREAVAALKRQRFGRRVTEEFETLRADQDAWDDYTRESEATAVADGVA